jgi:hypothetical protein
MSPLRVICVAVAVAAGVTALVIGEPRVYLPIFACALVLFVVGAGSIAADAFPLRSRLALVCSALTPPAALVLGLSGFLGIPLLVAVVPPLVVTAAPIVAPRIRNTWPASPPAEPLT